MRRMHYQAGRLAIVRKRLATVLLPGRRVPRTVTWAEGTAAGVGAGAGTGDVTDAAQAESQLAMRARLAVSALHRLCCGDPQEEENDTSGGTLQAARQRDAELATLAQHGVTDLARPDSWMALAALTMEAMAELSNLVGTDDPEGADALAQGVLAMLSDATLLLCRFECDILPSLLAPKEGIASLLEAQGLTQTPPPEEERGGEDGDDEEELRRAERRERDKEQSQHSFLRAFHARVQRLTTAAPLVGDYNGGTAAGQAFARAIRVLVDKVGRRVV